MRDHGPGIPAHILDRIFNPFFTTKDTGTGLGLAIVHRVVEAHDGTIIATNAEDGGAKFEIEELIVAVTDADVRFTQLATTGASWHDSDRR